MYLRSLTLATALACSLFAASAFAAVAIGNTAPDFSLTDSTGKTQTLSQYKGKTVVLEWNNPGCPFVHKHYESGNIPRQQAEATAAGVIWLNLASITTSGFTHVTGCTVGGVSVNGISLVLRAIRRSRNSR